MIATFIFVPPGGGKADDSLQFDIPGVPHAGDYVQIKIDGETGTRDFIVRRTWWHLEHAKIEPYADTDQTRRHGRTKGLMVECEYSKGPNASAGHLRAIVANRNPKHELTEFDSTAY